MLKQTLVSVPFVLSLAALLLNDFWLKAAYPGVLTGKISDFSGIAVVALLLFSALPRRSTIVYVALIAAFSWWKSPLSQPAIDAVNALSPFAIGRVVDYTDLFALLVLPLCHKLALDSGRHAMPWLPARRLVLVPLVGITLFGLMATSALQTRQQFVVRPSDPVATLSQQAVMDAIAEVAARHKLACVACEGKGPKVIYFGNGIHLAFSFPANNGVLFEVGAVPSGLFFGASGQERADHLRADLKATLAKIFKGLEYVEKLDSR